MLIVYHRQEVRLEVYTSARQQQIDCYGAGVRVARSIKKAMLRVRAGGIRVGEEGVIEYVVSNLSWHSGEEGGGDLRIDIWATGDLGNGGGF